MEEPTEWCAGMVVDPKARGKVKIYVDLTIVCDGNVTPCQQLNKPWHRLQVLDANSSFWQIPLSSELYSSTAVPGSSIERSTSSEKDLLPQMRVVRFSVEIFSVKLTKSMSCMHLR
jgi:hypothetical protein